MCYLKNSKLDSESPYLSSSLMRVEADKPKSPRLPSLILHNNSTHNVTKLRELLMKLFISEVVSKILDEHIGEPGVVTQLLQTIFARYEMPYKPMKTEMTSSYIQSGRR